MKGLLIKMNEEVLFKVENGVGIITLNRPERLNALTYNMVKSILNHLENWEKDNLIKISVNKADDLDYLNKAPIGLIKIDVEGHEINALFGAQEIILKNKPIIIFEQHSSEIESGTSEVISYLKSLDYEFFEIKKRFYMGESFLGRLLRELLGFIFLQRLSLVEAKVFEKKFYEMIVAIPKKKR